MEAIYWKQKDGTPINVDDMSITHLRNTLKLIIRANAARQKQVVVKKQHRFEIHGDIANDLIDQAILAEQQEQEDMFNY